MAELAIKTPANDLDLTRSWTDLPADDRKRKAATAARDRDVSTLWGLTRAYMLRGRSYSQRTLGEYQRNITRLVEAWADTNLLRPGPDSGHLYRLELTEGGLSVSTIRQTIAAARQLYAALRWAGATTAAPFADVSPGIDPTPPEEKRQPYSPGALQRLYHAATDPTMRLEPTTPLMLLLGAHSGLRVSEMLGLTWADIDRAAREVRVRKGKGGKTRTAPLSPDAVALLDQLEPGGGDDLVFSGVTSHALRDRMKRLCKRAGVDYLGLHALRHTAGTAYARAGTLEDAARILGHASIETTRVYAKWDKSTMHRLADGLTSVRAPLVSTKRTDR